MDTYVEIATILSLVGLLSTIVFLIFLVIVFIKKKDKLKKISVIGTVISFVVFLGFGGSVVGIALTQPDDEQVSHPLQRKKKLFKDSNSVQAQGFDTYRKCVVAVQSIMDDVGDSDDLSSSQASDLTEMFDAMIDVAEKVADDQHESVSDLADDLGGAAGESLDEDNDEDSSKDDDKLDEMKDDCDKAKDIIDSAESDSFSEDQKTLLNNYLDEMASDFSDILNIDDTQEAYNQLMNK